MARFALLLVVLLSMVAGCASGGRPVSANASGLPSIPPPAVTPGMGSVNMGTASFMLPIDAYGMSLHDVQMVGAAHDLGFYLCRSGSDTLSAAEMTAVRAWLTASPAPQRWYFGPWDASFIAQNGWPGDSDLPGVVQSRVLTDAEKATFQACYYDSDSAKEFVFAAPMFGTFTAGGDAADQLQRYWGEGFEYALQDQRFIDLTNQRNACITDKGYTVAVQPGETTGRFVPAPDWTDEQNLAAEVAVAQCADDMNYTQQVIDIVAAYQLLTVSQHEAELQAIKQGLDDLVVKATDFLKTYGVI